MKFSGFFKLYFVKQTFPKFLLKSYFLFVDGMMVIAYCVEILSDDEKEMMYKTVNNGFN